MFVRQCAGFGVEISASNVMMILISSKLSLCSSIFQVFAVLQQLLWSSSPAINSILESNYCALSASLL